MDPQNSKAWIPMSLRTSRGVQALAIGIYGVSQAPIMKILIFGSMLGSPLFRRLPYVVYEEMERSSRHHC